MNDDAPLPENSWSWKKYLSGYFNPLNVAKSSVFLFHMVVIVLVTASLIFSVIWLKRKLLKPKVDAPPVCISTQSGTVKVQSGDNKKIFGLINL